MTAPQTQTENSASHTSVDIGQIPHDIIEAGRERIAEILQGGIERAHGCVTADHVIDMVLRDEMQMWGITETDGDDTDVLAIFCTELMQYPTGEKACRIAIMSGTGMSKWLGLLPVVEEFARSEGCGTMEVHGRKGWGRVLPDYPEIFRAFRKDLRT